MSDLISRQKAIDGKIPIQLSNGVEIYDDEAVSVDYLKHLPSADVVERKKGEWIQDRLVSTNGGTYGVRRCSNCENYYQDVGYGWNFCPNCGADMRGNNNE